MEELKMHVPFHNSNPLTRNEQIGTTIIKTEPNIMPEEKLEYRKVIKQTLIFSQCIFTQGADKFIKHEADISKLNAVQSDRMDSFCDEGQSSTFTGSSCDPSGSELKKRDVESRRETNTLLKDEIDYSQKTECSEASYENSYCSKHVKPKINTDASSETNEDYYHDVKEISSAGNLRSQIKSTVFTTSYGSKECCCQNAEGSNFSNSKSNSALVKRESTMTSKDTTFCCHGVVQSSSSSDGLFMQNNCVRLISDSGSLPDFKPHKCDVCELRFRKPSDLKRHLRVHTGEKPFHCGQCELAFTRSSGLKKHSRTHSGEKPFMCSECPASFKQSSHMKTHMRSHTGEKPYKCDDCCMAFASSSDLKCHMRIHRGIRPYTCSMCGAVFTTSSGLNRHLRIHTGDKPFKCNMCEMSFIGSSILRYHLRSHTGEKPFSCNMCEMSFSYSASLRRHMRLHTGEKPYRCDIGCDATFRCLSSLKVHRRSHTGERPFKCDQCEMSCIDSSNLKKHCLRVHKSM